MGLIEFHRAWLAMGNGIERRRREARLEKESIERRRKILFLARDYSVLHENPITKDSLRQYSHLCSAELLRNRDWRGRIYDLTPQVRLGRCGV